jgi:hypothetical protein
MNRNKTKKTHIAYCFRQDAEKKLSGVELVESTDTNGQVSIAFW